MIVKEDIERLFKNQCSVEEAAAIINYLDSNPELISVYLDQTEWEVFKNEHSIRKQLSKKLWRNIEKDITGNRIRVFNWTKLSVAASIFIIFSTGLWYFNSKNENIVNVPLKELANIKFVSNNNKTNSVFRLPDSSIVELFPNSSISYLERFDSKKRNITLIGEAIFSVTKDKNRPFTVFSDVLSTNVLGTRFKVESYTNESSIKISLYEGSIVVKPIIESKRTIKSDIYLVPGQMLEFNKKSLETAVIKFKTVNNKNSNSIKLDNISIDNGNNWYMFNNQPLSEVFAQLEYLYNEKIMFNKHDVKGKTFIGKLDKTDSLHNILQSIGLLNNLVVTKKPDGYYISKK